MCSCKGLFVFSRAQLKEAAPGACRGAIVLDVVLCKRGIIDTLTYMKTCFFFFFYLRTCVDIFCPGRVLWTSLCNHIYIHIYSCFYRVLSLLPVPPPLLSSLSLHPLLPPPFSLSTLASPSLRRLSCPSYHSLPARLNGSPRRRSWR